MKRTSLLFYLLMLLVTLPAGAQKENNIWAFSDSLGLDFNSGNPVLIPTRITARESCASVCDASGALLFYSNGLKVFDKTHTVMPNGNGIDGAALSSATQGVAISPVPEEPGKYFLFTLDQIEWPGGTGALHYSLIDMSLNGGKGDIVPGFKNRLLAKDMSEKMVLASSCKGNWLITHDMNKPVFYAWPLRSSSVALSPVVSVTPGLSGTRYIMGEMKMSTDYRNLYMVNMAGYIEGFDFNLRTGIVDGYKNIDTASNAYSIELSADNKKVYVADFSRIIQYDLALLPDLAAVRASKNVIAGGPYISMRRGPDRPASLIR
ncbi:MAG: hypothetical protein JNL13_04700 [Chitinophagaceae bacterium]|nr:hypothetical protein [Chitinophagaceae bacterium]